MVSALERRGLSVLDREGDHVIMGIQNRRAGLHQAMNPTPELTPGVGFHLEGDGHWDVQEIPDWVLENAKFSGYLTIQGYSCAVFETSEGEQWAQKSSGTPAPKGDEGARDVLSSFHGMASCVAAMRTSRMQLDPNLLEAAQSMAEEMGLAEKSLHRAVQHGRRLSVEPSFEWIISQLEQTLQEFREFRKGASESVRYLVSDDE